jgi:putative sugar O-methyltransferase
MPGAWIQTKELADTLFWAVLRRFLRMEKGEIYRILGKSKLTREQEALLTLMRRDNAASHPPFRSSEHWIAANRYIDNCFHLEGLGELESQPYNNLFSSPPPDNFNVLRYATYMLYQKVKSRDSLNLLSRIPATVLPDSGLGFRFVEDHYVSWDLLISLDTLYSLGEIDASIWQEPVVVLDLGSGWGRIGYVLKLANPRCVYVACDLPETLLISSTYLPRKLPGERVHTYQQNREIGKFTRELLLQGGGLRFCGTQDLARFADKSIDFFINVASFQEMNLEQVRQYFTIIDRKVKGVLYLQEYWNGRERGLAQEIAGYSDYPFPPHWNCCFTRTASFSDLYFESAIKIS